MSPPIAAQSGAMTCLQLAKTDASVTDPVVSPPKLAFAAIFELS
jgi:hypothetical protein